MQPICWAYFCMSSFPKASYNKCHPSTVTQVSTSLHYFEVLLRILPNIAIFYIVLSTPTVWTYKATIYIDLSLSTLTGRVSDMPSPYQVLMYLKVGKPFIWQTSVWLAQNIPFSSLIKNHPSAQKVLFMWEEILTLLWIKISIIFLVSTTLCQSNSHTPTINNFNHSRTALCPHLNDRLAFLPILSKILILVHL